MSIQSQTLKPDLGEGGHSDRFRDRDGELVDLATAAVQAQERLTFHLRHAGEQYAQGLSSSNKTLDEMRLFRSRLEGTSVTSHMVVPHADALQRLKQVVLMHVPSSLTDQVREEIRDLVTQALSGFHLEVFYVALFTCPWYQYTQDERGQQAKHNSLVVVYREQDSHVLAPLSLHDRDETQVLDMGWFYAVEALHFANHLAKGKVRFVELLYLAPSSEVCHNHLWERLRQLLKTDNVLGLRGFIEQCRGQAVGGVGRKSKTGNMKVKDTAVLYEFCESFRLLDHVSRGLERGHLDMNTLQPGELSTVAVEALGLLTAAYKTDDPTGKVELFNHVTRWRARVDEMLKGKKWTPLTEVETELGQWLQYVRQGDTWTPRPLAVKLDQQAKLQALMQRIGGPVQKMAPENILMIAQAGSHLYDLATPSSDVDFVVIYADPIEKVVCSCRRPQESIEDRGPTKSLEYGAYEARLFTEMAWKGSVVMVELVFVDNLDYTSDSWQKLVCNRQKFVTEKTILQYLGLISNNMATLHSGKHKGSPREKKLFYQIFHKLYSLEFFMRGETPAVRCSGPTKDFIMKIRKGPLEGDELCRDVLYEKAKQAIKEVRQALASRDWRLPEDVPHDFLTNWLMDVRGWTDKYCSTQHEHGEK